MAFKRKMKICIDGRALINRHTGLGRYILNLVKSLLKIDAENHYVVLVQKNLHSNHPIFSLSCPNLTFLRVNLPGVSLRQQFFLPLIIRPGEFNVYHYPNFDFPIGVSLNSVMTIHDLTYVKYEDIYRRGRRLKNYYTKRIIKYGLERARKIVAVSNSTKTDLLEIFNVPEEKIEVIYEAFSGNSRWNGFLAKQQPLSKSYEGLSSLDNYFLFVGERRPHKNLPRIIEAFYQFKKSNPNNYKLVICGKPYSNYREPEKMVLELGLSEDVVFVGYVEEQDLPLFYGKAVAFLFTSIYEGFGLPILEAMAFKTPVITSNISAMSEIASDAAITVNPYAVDEITDALKKISTDFELRERLVNKGSKRWQEFSWDRAAEQTLKLYQEVSMNNWIG